MKHADAEIFLGRRYLAKGFLDDALRAFMQHAQTVPAEDWIALRDRLIDRGRIADAVNVCHTGNVPVPREELLSIGDQYLARADIDRAIDIYNLIEADAERWERVVDRLIELPDRQHQARSITAKYLGGSTSAEPERPRLVKVVK